MVFLKKIQGKQSYLKINVYTSNKYTLKHKKKTPEQSHFFLYNLAEKLCLSVSSVSSLCGSPTLSKVTPEAPCDRIEEPASSIVNLEAGLFEVTEAVVVRGGAFRIGFPLKSFLGLSSGDITSASSSAVSSGKMLGLVP